MEGSTDNDQDIYYNGISVSSYASKNTKIQLCQLILYFQQGTAHCSECSSESDQYKITKELAVAIELNVNHSKCIKEKLNPNN